MNQTFTRGITKVLALFLAIVLLLGLSPLERAESAGSIPIPIYVELNRFDNTNVGGDGTSTLLWAPTLDSRTNYANFTADGFLRVAPAIKGTVGSVVRRNRIQLSGGFSTYFVMNLNSGSSTPADGMTFIIQGNTEPIVGGFGENLGFGGIPNSLGVEFDIYRNGDQGDPYSHHVAIVQNGSVNHANYPASAYSTPWFDLYGWDDVHVWVDYATDGTLSVKYGLLDFDGTWYTETVQANVGTELLNKEVYVGFAAATGTLFANHDIKKWYFSDSYVPGGLSTDESTYTQGASSVDIVLSGDPTDPSEARFLVKDANGQNMVNQEVSIYVDGPRKFSIEDMNTGASGTEAFYSLAGLMPGRYTLKAVASGSGGATSTVSFDAPLYEQTTPIDYDDAIATYGDAPFTHKADGGSSMGAFSYTSSNAAIATIDAHGLVTLHGAGTTTLTAIKAGDIAYKEASQSCTLTVNPATLTPIATAANKTYDGTTAATGSISLAGIVSEDSVAASGTFSFADPVVADDKTVSVTGITLSGADATNYALSTDNTTALANITKAPLTITADNQSKTYGDEDPELTASYSGLATGDDHTVVTGLQFTRAAGEDVTPDGYVITPSGATAANYTISYVDGKLTILEKPISAIHIIANDKVYDGDTIAAFNVTSAGLTGQLVDDDVSLETTGVSGTFDNRNAGQNKTVTVSGLSLAGTKAMNYSLLPYTTTANIAPKPITAINITAGSKIYDGTESAVPNVSSATLGEGVVTGDSVTLDATGATGTFVNKNAGNGKTVTVTGLILSGDHAANYELQAYTTIADIGKATLTATVGNYSRTYGSANPSFAVDVAGFVAGESAATATGYDAPVASSTATALTGVSTAEITIAGGSADNYTFDTSDTGILTIERKTLTARVGDYQKIYGEENPTFLVEVTGFANDETADTALGYAAPTASSAATATSGVGTAAITIEGGAASNYVFDISDTGTLTTAPKTLVATVGDYSKTYGEDNPSFSVTVEGFVNGETALTADEYDAPVAGSTATALTDVGTAEILITGGDATNYTFDRSDKGVLTINPKTISATATVDTEKTYDGSTATTGSINLADVLAEDVDQVLADGTFTYSDPNVGVGKLVNVTEITLTGEKAANYALDSTTVATTGTIKPAPLTIRAVDQSKVYGDADPSFTVTYSGFAPGEDQRLVSDLQVNRTAGEDVLAEGYAIVPSSATADNYSISYVNGTLSITPAPLVVQANDLSKSYGSADPELTVSFNGLKRGDQGSVVSGLSVTREAGEAVKDGGYTITPSGGSATNYSISYLNGTLTINKAPLTVTADNKSKVYGAAEPVLSYTPSGTLYYGDSYDVITGVGLSTETGAAATAGTHDITVTGGTAANYNITHVNGTLTVDKAALTVTADNKSKTYGQADPTLSYTPSGTLYYGDGYNVITDVDLSTATGAAATAGNHEILASGGSAANYNITHVSGTLTVGQAPLTVTADDKSKTYGATEPTLTYTASGTLYYGDGYNVITGVDLSTATGAAATAGTHEIAASGGTADNYNITHVNGALTVGQAPLTVTADDKSKTYGETDPALSYTPSGTLYYGDGYGVITGVSLSTATGAAATAGTHDITVTGGTAANYDITHVYGTLTVDQAHLTVAADDKYKVYGEAEPTLTYTASGTLYYGDNYDVITSVSLSTATDAAATAGSHDITVTSGTAANYNITHVKGTLTVDRAALTVTADDKAKVYGGIEPTLSYTPSGTLHYTDTYDVISGVSLSTATGAAATAGTHTIAATGATAANYDITHVYGTLTVDQAPLTVTADDKSKVYGGLDPTLSYTPSGTLYYEDSYDVISGVDLSTETGAAATAGTHEIAVVGGTAANYNVTHVSGTLTVDKAALTVTADNKDKVYGAADPTLSYTPSGTLFYEDNYDVITGVDLSTATGAAATAGTHEITVTGGTAANYNITHVNGALTVDEAALTVTADDKSKTYGDAEPTLSYTPSGTLYYGDSYDVITGVSMSTETGAAATAGTHDITVTGGTAANYNITRVKGTLTVEKAALTVTADDQSKVYGAADPTLTYTPSGTLYYGDKYDVITGVSLSTATGASATAGSHDITVTGGTAANYNITRVKGTLTVDKAALTVTADDKSKVYGDAEPTLTYTPSGTLYYGDNYDVITSVSLSTAADAAATAGTHGITVTGGTAANYNISHVNGTLTVSKATLTVIADDKSKVYGEAEPTLTYTASGTLYYGDNYDVITSVSLSTATDAAATAGTHGITVTGGTAANYNISHVNGTLTVSKATLTVIADDKSKVYGEAEPTLIYTASGTLYYGDGYNVISGIDLSTATGADATAGTHDITVTGGTAANYNITRVKGTLTVDKAALTVTADNQSKVYGAADPALSYTPSGALYYGDSYNVITDVELSTATGAAATAGTHGITVTGGTAANYNVTHVNGTLTVDKASLTVTADDKSKVYGTADPALTYTPSGTLYYGDNYDVITGVSLSTETGAAATAGTHEIAVVGGTAANYNVTHVNGTLTVDKAALTVTADNKDKVYGTADPALTYTPSGTLYYGDNYDVITGVSLSTETGAAATAGTHEIAVVGGTAANYNVTHVNGTLTVDKAALTVTADDKSKVYGAAEPMLTYTPSGTLFYTDSYEVITGVDLSTATGAAATAGTHDIAVSGTAANYEIAHVNGTLTVSQAPLSVTADDKSKTYGQLDPTLSYTPSGTLYYGDSYDVITGVSLSTETGAAATAGTHEIAVVGGTAANYNVTHVNGTLTVDKASLTVTADDKSKVYGAADPTLSYTPSGTLFYGDSYDVITGVDLSTATGAAATAGTHEIAASGGTADNYNITHVNGTLTVSKAALTVTADNKDKVYGAADPALSYTPSGTLYYGDGYDVITGVRLSTETGAAATAGTHEIAVTGGTAVNYNITHVNGTLAVGKAALTVTADDKSKVYGAAEPMLTYTPSGTLFYTDSYEVITGVDLSTATGAAATAGTHEIELVGGTAANYEITHVRGTLTVNPKAIDAIDITAQNKYYDATKVARLSTWRAGLQGIVEGDDVSLDVSNAVGEFSDASIGFSKPVTVNGLSLVGADAGNYVLNPYTTSASISHEPDPDPDEEDPEEPAPSDPSADSRVEIIVNGEPAANSATAVVSTEGEQTVTTIKVSEESLAASLQQAGEGSVVTIPGAADTDIVAGELTGQMVKDMELQSVTLEVKTDRSVYTLPAQEINIDAVSAELGEDVTLADIIVRVEIAEPKAEQVQVVESIADDGNYTLIVPPLEFSISCSYGEQTVEVSQFNSYVERTVAIPEDVDPTRVTTAVVVLPDGSFGHVPTKVIVIDGKYYAQVNSLTNSTYTLIWNEVEFADTATHWAKADIHDMASRLVVGKPGEQNFGPDVALTRAEFAAIIVKALGLKPGTGNNPFADITEANEYRAYIETAYQYGIVGGHGDGLFAPNAKVTREQAMAMITRAMSVTDLQVELAAGEAETVLASFVDQRSISSWARSVAATSVKSGLIAGKGGRRIAPQANVTRAELVVIVRRLLQHSNLI